MTTTIHTLDRITDGQELPALTPADRAALALGTRLILWGERNRVRRAERAVRAEQARTARAGAQAATANRAMFERRAQAGPTW